MQDIYPNSKNANKNFLELWNAAFTGFLPNDKAKRTQKPTMDAKQSDEKAAKVDKKLS